MATKLTTANSMKAAVMPNRTFSPRRRPPVFIAATPALHEGHHPLPLADHDPRAGYPPEVEESDHSLVGHGNHGISGRARRCRGQKGRNVDDILIGEIM